MRVVRQGSGVSPRTVLTAIVVIAVVLWFLLGGPFYIVGPEEEGVVLTFGRHTATVGPGFHLKLPWPIQVVYKPAVNIIQRIEIGFRTVEGTDPPQFRGFASDREMLQEAQMLTGDENIINCAAIIQYRIKDSADYLFNVRDQEGTLRDISEASIRLVIGDNSVDAVLTTGKLELQNRIHELIQTMADNYGLGVSIVAVQLMDVQPPNEVSAAFKDVATAREDMQAYINDAEGYRNQVIPAAIADSVTLVNEAMGYATIRINQARGESSRFVAVAEEYRKSPGVTVTRLHLEALLDILSKVRVTVVDGSAGALTHYDLGGGQ
jgi:membrane protease subunit HflK